MASRAALGAVLLAGAAACAARSDLRGIGTSSDAVPGTTPREADGGVTASPASSSPIPRDFRAAWVHPTGRFVSVGHAGGRWEAEVYADERAADVLRTGRGVVPTGARFVEEHFERGDAGAAGPIFLMEKRPPGFDPAHGDWRYVAVGASGDVVADGPVASCAGCHGDAPGDHVFRAGAPATSP